MHLEDHDIEGHIEEVLSTLLPKNEHKEYTEKVIHDNLLESCTFQAWEMALLDTPLLQRLRRIHQLGTAFFTYPSAVHNRFSHTLGVTTLAGQLYKNLRLKSHLSSLGEEESRNEEATVRLAGLLHDIGHTFFSHCSEEVVKPFWDSFIREDPDLKGLSVKPHEYIAYRIIKSRCFKQYWEEVVKPQVYGIQIDLDHVASIIVGKNFDDRKAYMTQIINGHYDVDKLEYLHRDAKPLG